MSLKILIVEDESSVAQRIERLLRQVLNDQSLEIQICLSYQNASQWLENKPIDVLLLDLNLNGQDGFNLIRNAAAESFDTIVISANTDQAIVAYELGVLDFLAKPLLAERLKIAFDRRNQTDHRPNPTQFLFVKFRGSIIAIPCEDIWCIEASNNVSMVHLESGKKYVHEKSLTKLLTLLPDSFVRVHRSYIVNESYLEGIERLGAGQYRIRCHNGQLVPMGRSVYPQFKKRWDL